MVDEGLVNIYLCDERICVFAHAYTEHLGVQSSTRKGNTAFRSGSPFLPLKSMAALLLLSMPPLSLSFETGINCFESGVSSRGYIVITKKRGCLAPLPSVSPLQKMSLLPTSRILLSPFGLLRSHHTSEKDFLNDRNGN